MKTSVIEVHGMLLALSADAVEKRIRKVPGVESVTVNDVAGNAAVRYDETLLDIADIKAAVHQSEYQTAGESEPKHVSEHKPAGKRVAAPTSQAAPAPAPALTPVPVVPKTSAAVPAAPVPAAAGGAPQDKAVPSAPPSASAATPAAAGAGGHAGHTASGAPAAGEAAPDVKPAAPAPIAPKTAPLASAATPAPTAKSSLPATVEPKADSWKVRALSLATTLGVTYSACAIFDLLFPPFGLLAALAPVSPLPISGSALGFLTGFALFTVAGLVLGALHGIVSEFWSKRLH